MTSKQNVRKTEAISGDNLRAEAEKSLLTLDEYRAEQHNAIGKNSLYNYVAAGRIKSIKIGRKILIPRSELVDFPLREIARQEEQK